MNVITLDFSDPKTKTAGYGFQISAWVSGQMLDRFEPLGKKSRSKDIDEIIRKAVAVYDLLLHTYASDGVVSIVAADGEKHHIRIDV